MRRNIVKYGNQEDIDRIMELAEELKLYTFMSEGVLVNNYFVETQDKISIGRAKRKNIIIKENFLNEWSSNYKIILTDKEYDFSSEEDFEKILKIM